MIDIKTYIDNFNAEFDNSVRPPWEVVNNLPEKLSEKIESLSDDYIIVSENVAIHKTAKVEDHSVIKGPAIISEGCFIGAHAYLRGGVFLGRKVVVGPGCEIKSSVILSASALAHFNFVGDSVVGSGVNMEAGSIIANHFNERTDKTIFILVNGKKHPISSAKFGALIGDGTRIGANAVLSPGTLLQKNSVVKRLELVEQCPL